LTHTVDTIEPASHLLCCHIARPSVSSSVQITTRSFRYASRTLPVESALSSFLHFVNHILFTLLLESWFTSSACITSSQSQPLLSPSPSVFHSRLRPKTHPFHKSFPFLNSHSYSFRTAFTDLEPVGTEISGRWRLFVLVSSFSYFSLAACARLS